MGAQQAYHWAVIFPEMVERILPSCVSARVSGHNVVFLEGLKAALTADSAWNEGRYLPSEAPQRGLKAFGRVYAGWAYSHAFFRQQLYSKLGFSTIEALLHSWEQDHLSRDANDLLAMLWTWQHADISNNTIFSGNFQAALRSIRAKTIVMPSKTDLYFHWEDSVSEVQEIPGAEYREFDSAWGHIAGAPGRNPEDVETFDRALRDLLAM